MEESGRPLHVELRKVLQQRLEDLGVPHARAAFFLYQVDAEARRYLLLATENSKDTLEDGLRQAFGLKPQGIGLWVLFSEEASMIVDAWSAKPVCE